MANEFDGWIRGKAARRRGTSHGHTSLTRKTTKGIRLLWLKLLKEQVESSKTEEVRKEIRGLVGLVLRHPNIVRVEAENVRKQ